MINPTKTAAKCYFIVQWAGFQVRRRIILLKMSFSSEGQSRYNK